MTAALKLDPQSSLPQEPVSDMFVQFCHDRAAATGQPVEGLLNDPWLQSFAKLVEETPPKEQARYREMLRLRQELYGGDILAESRAMLDGTHPLARPRHL
jgi:hypothetical protein